MIQIKEMARKKITWFASVMFDAGSNMFLLLTRYYSTIESIIETCTNINQHRNSCITFIKLLHLSFKRSTIVMGAAFCHGFILHKFVASYFIQH